MINCAVFHTDKDNIISRHNMIPRKLLFSGFVNLIGLMIFKFEYHRVNPVKIAFCICSRQNGFICLAIERSSRRRLVDASDTQATQLSKQHASVSLITFFMGRKNVEQPVSEY